MTDPVLPVDSDSPPATAGALHLRPAAITAVAIGGVIGASLRYAAGVVHPTASGHWPVTTFAVNIVGAFVLGFLLEALVRLGPDTGWRQLARLGVGTGVLGAFTTYSTLAVETDLLLRDGQPWHAATYGIGTVVVGMIASGLGIAAGTVVARRTERQT